MTDEKKEIKNTASKKAIALVNLATSKGNIKKGDEFTCTAKEYQIFKKAKAI